MIKSELILKCNFQVVWHPGSLYDNYLAVLTSDNFLRIYNLEDVEEGSVKAEQVRKGRKRKEDKESRNGEGYV